ncbi:phosphotransferase [Brachybacterium fresconis]|uniref:Aminoglycoside phosphotransferase domain-containing protein n=1 Tax=Brachybacterium fresconis TaxID=173363 RepID=A0ABS4YNK8_9MICO|nr:phosphotransferase [Brachybacterium fresconis]MBP2410348.1 hypothetical protein [Brachybacterium fresconis]
MTNRLRWADFPDSLRSRLEEVLGGSVRTTSSCVGGFSSSSAEIIRSSAGRSLFVKAVRAQDNPASMRLNRSEAAALAHIPRAAPVPRLVTAFDHQDWFVLVTEVAAGSLPEQPWSPEQLDSVLTALDTLQAAATPCPVPDLPTVAESLGPDMLGFDRIAEEPPTDLDPWIVEHLDDLRAAAYRGIGALDGDSLCHSDVRSDNLLITASGAVSLVDWAWASRGSPVADALQLLSSIEDPHGTLLVNERVDAVLERHGLPHSFGTDVLVGILGFFVDAARWPVDPRLPLLSPHRRARRDSLLPLVTERWAGSPSPSALPS